MVNYVKHLLAVGHIGVVHDISLETLPVYTGILVCDLVFVKRVGGVFMDVLGDTVGTLTRQPVVESDCTFGRGSTHDVYRTEMIAGVALDFVQLGDE